MKGRPSVNKRLREMARKERQAEKHLRRDERRANRNAPEDASAPADGVEGGDVALESAPAAPEPPPGT